MVNPLNLLKQVGQLRQQAGVIQKELEDEIVEESCGGVKLKMNGKMEIINLEIEAHLLSPENKRKLEKELIFCWNKGVKEIQSFISKNLQEKLGMNLPI